MTHPGYSLAWLAAAPLAVARLAWRSRRQPGYLERLPERFGRYAASPGVPRIWMHAVSVGETRAAALLSEATLRHFPGHQLLLTHMTPTGRATGAELFGAAAEQAWLPYDTAGATRAFLRHFRPRVGVILETEVWPRLLEQARREGVPVVLANGRLSERSARRYARFATWSRWAFSNLAAVAAQTEAEAQRFRALGAREVEVLGNIKFDLEVPGGMVERGAALRAQLGAGRPVWVAGSTREGEEALLLDALAAAPPQALLVIVPRHPHRFDEVEALARARGFEVARRSALGAVPASTRVVIGDTMGEMLAYYAAADVVVMGGSLLDYGSQNLIEACALSRPVIVGPSTFNFEAAADGAIAAGGAVRVADAAAALAEAAALTADASRRQRMGEAGAAFVAGHRGAVERTAAWIAVKAAEANAPARG
jgi:3-deoxy-D-manno-octulosonic-acid transferase